MRGAEKPDPTRRTLVLEPFEMGTPGDEVVDLLEVDAAAEELELGLELTSCPFDRARPDLGRYQGVRTTTAQRPTQHAFRPSVQRPGCSRRSGAPDCRCDSPVLGYHPDIVRGHEWLGGQA